MTMLPTGRYRSVRARRGVMLHGVKMMRAPQGYTKEKPLVINGKPYIGGQVIPNTELDKLSKEEKQKLEGPAGGQGQQGQQVQQGKPAQQAAAQPNKQSSGQSQPSQAPAQSGQKNQSEKVQAIIDTLSHGEVLSEKNLGGGVNQTVLLDFGNGKGVFKPSSGEKRCRYSVPVGTYYKREVATYDMAKLMGMSDLVPPTVVREHKGLTGSIQAFVTNAVEAQKKGDGEYKNGKASGGKWNGERDLARAAALDFATLNTDRHDKNWMVHGSGKLFLIDNGLSFPDAHDRPQYGQSMLLEQAIRNRAEIPPEVKQHVAAKAPAILKKLAENGLTEKEIKLTMERLKLLADPSVKTFDDMWGKSKITTVGSLAQLTE